jgi:hypothetical protein
MERLPIPWIGRTNIVKMTIIAKSHLQMQCDFQQKNAIIFSTGTENCLKFYMEVQNILESQNDNKGKSNAGDIAIPDFKLYYRAAPIQTVCYRHQNGHNGQWNNTKDSHVSPDSHSHLVFDKEAKGIHWRKGAFQ